MRDVLHCQRELKVLLRTEASGIQPHNALLHTHGKTQACINHASSTVCKNTVLLLGFGLVWVLVKKGICLSVCGVYESLF